MARVVMCSWCSEKTPEDVTICVNCVQPHSPPCDEVVCPVCDTVGGLCPECEHCPYHCERYGCRSGEFDSPPRRNAEGDLYCPQPDNTPMYDMDGGLYHPPIDPDNDDVDEDEDTIEEPTPLVPHTPEPDDADPIGAWDEEVEDVRRREHAEYGRVAAHWAFHDMDYRS